MCRLCHNSRSFNKCQWPMPQLRKSFIILLCWKTGEAKHSHSRMQAASHKCHQRRLTMVLRSNQTQASPHALNWGVQCMHTHTHPQCRMNNDVEEYVVERWSSISILVYMGKRDHYVVETTRIYPQYWMNEDAQRQIIMHFASSASTEKLCFRNCGARCNKWIYV